MEIPIPEHLSEIGLALIIVYIVVKELIDRTHKKSDDENVVEEMRDLHEKAELSKVLRDLSATIEKNTSMLDSILEEQRFFRAEITRLNDLVRAKH